MATYTAVVVFTRESSDDLPVADAGGITGTDQHKLLQQLRKELQQACDDGILAGQFNITEVNLA